MIAHRAPLILLLWIVSIFVAHVWSLWEFAILALNWIFRLTY